MLFFIEKLFWKFSAFVNILIKLIDFFWNYEVNKVNLMFKQVLFSIKKLHKLRKLIILWLTLTERAMNLKSGHRGITRTVKISDTVTLRRTHVKLTALCRKGTDWCCLQIFVKFQQVRKNVDIKNRLCTNYKLQSQFI